MNKFTAGLIAGGIAGTVGIGYLMSDSKSRHKMSRDSKKLMKKGKAMIDNMTDMF